MSNKDIFVISDEAINAIRSNLNEISANFSTLESKLEECGILEDLGFDSGSIHVIKKDILTNKEHLSTLDKCLASLLSKSKENDDNIAKSLINLQTVYNERTLTTL